MKKLTRIMLISIIMTCSINAQGLKIGSGTLFSLGGAELFLPNNWNNSGTFDAGTGTVIFNGVNGNQTIANTLGETFYNIIVNKAADSLQLVNDITVNGNLTVTSGLVDLNGNILTLGSTANLIETEGNTVVGETGYITTTRTLNAPNGNNAAGLGAEITSSADLGSTIIKRGYTAQTGNGNTGINRYYEIASQNNSSLDASLVFHYDISELNGINENDLALFKSEDNGATWTLVNGAALDVANHKITANNISSFSLWTLAGSSSPLPIELTSFTANVNENKVKLNWQTATEVNNYGFEIEKAMVNAQSSMLNWEKVGFVQGNGTTNSPKEYSFTDSELPNAEKVYYRLKQIDNDGTFTYSKEVTVDLSNITGVEDELPTVFSLSQNYPNPFNPTTKIKYQIPSSVGMTNVRLRIFDVLGNEVATLVNEEKAPGKYEVTFDGSKLASGIYFYRLQAGSFTSTKKLILMK